MPTAEIQKFREKFPQYNDWDDSTVADKLARKYPEYRDLPGKVYSEKFRTETLAPFTHAASLFAGDIPKALASRDISPEGKEAYEQLYPEQQTFGGKALRIGLSIPAAAGGIAGKAFLGAGKILRAGAEAGTRIIPKFAGKSLLGRTALRTGEFTAGQAVIAQEEGKDYGEQVKGAALTGAALPGAGLLLKGTAKNILRSGRFIAKNFGGITDFSRDKIKELGSARVFDPLKASISYIGDVIVPKAKEIISKNIVETKNIFILRNIGLNDEEIKNLQTLNPIYQKKLQSVLSGESINIKQGIEAIKKDASDRFSFLMKRVNPNLAVNVKSFYGNLKSTLRKMNWIDRDGNKTLSYGPNQVRDRLLEIYKNLTETIKTGKGGYRDVINIREYENLRNSLSITTGHPENDRLLFKLGAKLRDSAAKTIKGLEGINKFYSDAERLIEIEERGIFSKTFNSERLTEEIKKIRNIDKPDQVKRIKSMIGDELSKDVDAHLVNMDLGLVTQKPGTLGGVFPGQSGIKKVLLAEAAKKYYRDVYPFTQKVKSGYEALKTSAEKAYQEPLFKGGAIERLQKFGKKGEVSFGKKKIETTPIPQGKQGIVEAKGKENLLAEAR